MRKIIFLLLVLVLVVIGFVATAQSTSDMTTDRPDQTEAPVLVPQGGFQMETGFFIERTNQKNTAISDIGYNTSLLKYGVNENLELRFITEYLGHQTKNREGRVSNVKGFSPIAVGVKLKLADEKKFWPQAALIGHINLKTGSKAFEPSNTAADFRFTFSHTLSDKWSLSYNLGAEWNGETPEATFLYTLAVGYALTNKLGAFIESYSFFPESSKADNRMDGGFTYKVNSNFQLDISGGLGLSSNAPDYFVSTGLSFRILNKGHLPATQLQ